MRKKKIHFTSVVWKEGKYYVAQCLNVDVSSFGKTRRGALKNLEEALGLYVEDGEAQFVNVDSPTIEVRGMQYA